jgi:hypothetical protein
MDVSRNLFKNVIGPKGILKNKVKINIGFIIQSLINGFYS